MRLLHKTALVPPGECEAAGARHFNAAGAAGSGPAVLEQSKGRFEWVGREGRAPLFPLHRKGAARHIHVGAAVPRSGQRKKSVQNGSTEMPASGTKSDRCRRKTVALRPAQQGGRRSISNAPPSGGMRNGRPPAKGAVLFELRPW